MLADHSGGSCDGATRQPLVAGFRLLTIAAIERESELVSSFWLAAPDGEMLPEPVAGQFLPIAVDVPEHGILRRTYTISGHEDGRYRISIKRERLPGKPEGRVSNFVHERWRVGSAVSTGMPQGQFVLDGSSTRPVLMLAGGIGITPLLAMLRALARSEPMRRVVLVIGARNGGDDPFRDEIARLRGAMPGLRTHTRYSDPGAADVVEPGNTGFIDETLLASLLPDRDVDVYLCGPAPFMAAMDRGLSTLGVPRSRIRSEAFGPASLERHHAPEPVSGLAPVVTFALSGIAAPFDAKAHNLLEFAEDIGLSPPFSCRSGHCGACATRKVSGAVRYLDPPTAAIGADEILLCCALPDGAVTIDA